MDGEIGLDSVPDDGSTFWFRIPLPVAHRRTTVPAPGFLDGLRVLVVDDNATNRLVLESQLRGWKLQPEAVPDADARTALIRAKEAAAQVSRSSSLSWTCACRTSTGWSWPAPSSRRAIWDPTD